LKSHFKLIDKELEVHFSFSAGFFNGKRHKKLNGQKMRTWLDDVGEVLPSDGSEVLVHVLQKSHRDEEAGFEPLVMGISLLLKQLECLSLVVVLVDDLLDHRQDPNVEATSWDCGNFFFFTGCM